MGNLWDLSPPSFVLVLDAKEGIIQGEMKNWLPLLVYWGFQWRSSFASSLTVLNESYGLTELTEENNPEKVRVEF